jgi:hypothetical protein
VVAAFPIVKRRGGLTPIGTVRARFRWKLSVLAAAYSHAVSAKLPSTIAAWRTAGS